MPYYKDILGRYVWNPGITREEREQNGRIFGDDGQRLRNCSRSMYDIERDMEEDRRQERRERTRYWPGGVGRHVD